MASSLSSSEKLKLNLFLKEVIDAHAPETIDGFIETASGRLEREITEANVRYACQAWETTPAEVFAKPAELVPSLKAKIRELEAKIEVLTGRLEAG